MSVTVRFFAHLLLLLALCAGGCATLDDERASSPWYDGTRFRNLDNDDELTDKSFWTMLPEGQKQWGLNNGLAGAESPRWFMKAAHIDLPEAVVAAQDLGARILLPVHWATFRQSDEKMMEPILYLQAEAEKKKLPYRHWSPGESYDLDIR